MLPDFLTGANVSVEQGEIDAIKEENKKLKELKTSLDNKIYTFLYVVKEGQASSTLTEIEEYRKKAVSINQAISGDAGYQYIDTFRSKLLDQTKNLQTDKTYIGSKFGELKKVYEKIDNIIEDNKEKISEVQTRIDTIRNDATNRYYEELSRRWEEFLNGGKKA